MGEEEEEEEEEEAEEEEAGGKGVSKYWVLVSLLLFLLLIVATLLAVFFYLKSEDKQSSPPTKSIKETNPMIQSRSLKESDNVPHSGGTDVKVIWSKRNFTDANQVCTHQTPDGQLMFPRSANEESIVMEQFKNIYNSESHSEKTKDCGDEYFIGLRKTKDKEFMTPTNQFLIGPPLTNINYSEQLDSPQRQCFNLHIPYGQIFSFDCTHSIMWNCFLCQRHCPTETAFCYQIYYDERVFDFNSAKEYCKRTSPPSQLAIIPHQSVIDDILRQYPKKMQRCNSVGIGHKFSKKYESVKETPTPYKSNRFFYPSDFDKHLSMNCVVINANNKFLWEPEYCVEPHCFVCVTSNKQSPES